MVPIIQHRIAQETLLYKDEQLREAHAWIARVQEMDALQSTTNHSLQAELRERKEQYNQLWLGCQRQVGSLWLCDLRIIAYRLTIMTSFSVSWIIKNILFCCQIYELFCFCVSRFSHSGLFIRFCNIKFHIL